MAEYSPLDSLLQTSQGVSERKQELLEEASQRKKNKFNPINAENLVHIDGDTWGLKDTGQVFRAGTADPAEGYDTFEKSPERYSKNPDQWRAHRRNYAKLTGKPEFLISKDEVAEYGRLQQQQTAERMEALARDGRLQLRPTGQVDAYGRHIAEAVDLSTGQSLFDSGREQNANYDSDRNAERQIRDIFGGEDAQYRVDDRSIRQVATDQIGNFTSGALNMANDILQAGSVLTGARNEWTDEFFENNKNRVQQLKEYMVSDAQLQREGRDQRNAARNSQLYDLRKAEYLEDGLSDRSASIRAGTDEFLDSVRDMILNPGAILDKTVESLPYMIGVGLAGRAAAQGATNLLTKRVSDKALKAGLTAEQAAVKAAEYTKSKAGRKLVSRITTATGVGTVGITEGLSTSASIYSSILNMSEEEALQSEKYQALRLEQGMTHKEAVQNMAEEAMQETFLTAVAVAGGASLITGAAGFESKLFTRMADVRKEAVKATTKGAAKEGVSRSLTGRVIGGAARRTGQYARFAGPAGLKEAGEEAIQGGSSAFLEQLAQFEAGVGEEPGAGVGRAAGEGAVVGFASGAGARSVSGAAKAIGNANIRTSGLPQIKRSPPGSREAVVDRSGAPGGSKERAVNSTKNLTPEKARNRIKNIVKRVEKGDANAANTLRRFHEFEQAVEAVGYDNLSENEQKSFDIAKQAYTETIDKAASDILKEAKPLETLEVADRQILQAAMEADAPSVQKIAKNDNAVARIYKQVKRTVQLIENAQNKALETAGEYAEIDKKYNKDGTIAQEKMGRGLASNGKPGLMGHYELISEAIAKGDDKAVKSRSEALSNFIASQGRKLNKVKEAIDAKADKNGVTYQEGSTEGYYNQLREEMADMVKVRDGLEAIYQGWQGEQTTESKGRVVTPIAQAPKVPAKARVVQTIEPGQEAPTTPEGVVTPRRNREERTEQGPAESAVNEQLGSERSAATETEADTAESAAGSDQRTDTEATPGRTETQSESSESSDTESAATPVDLESMTVRELKALARSNPDLPSGWSKLNKGDLINFLRNNTLDEASQAEVDQIAQEQAAAEEANTDTAPKANPATSIYSDNDFHGSLASIAANSESPLHRRLATRLADVLQGREIGVITLDDNAFEAYMRAYAPDLVDATAAFLTDRQEVVMREKYRNHQNMEQAFLHEAIHAALNGWMTRPKTTPTGKALHTRAQNIRKHLLRELRKLARDNPSDTRYAETLQRLTENQEEWITYAWSNPEVQDVLREIPMTKTLTVWDGLVKLVKDILGLEGRTALDHVLAVSDKIFEQNKGQRAAGPREGATYTPSPEAVQAAQEALEADGGVVEQAEAQPERSSETEPEGPSAEDIATNDRWWDALREAQRLIAALDSGQLQDEEVSFQDDSLQREFETRLQNNTAAGALAQMETYIRERLNESLPRTQQSTAELKLPEIIRLAQEMRAKGRAKAANKVIQSAEGFDNETGFNRIQRWLLGTFDRPNIQEFIQNRFAQIGVPVSVDKGFRQASKTAKSLITAVPNLHEVLANPAARRELYDALELTPTEEKAFETFRQFRNEFANAVGRAFEELSGGKIQFPDGNRIEQNPAYLLTGLADVMDPAAVTAMAYESMNWLGGDGQRLSNDKDAIIDILGLPENHELTPEQKRLTTAGTLRRNVVSSLGRAAYRHLNIVANQDPNTSPNLDERMEQALGTLAVRALIVSNRVEPVIFDGKDFADMLGESATEHENSDRPVNFVRIMSEGRTGRDRFYHSDKNADLIDDTRPGRTVFTRLFGVSDVIKEPLKQTPTEDNVPKKALRSLMVVSKKLQKAISNQQERAWTTDTAMIETLKRFDSMQDFLAAGHEYQLNMNEVHAIDKDAVMARNRTLESMFENAVKWYDENETDDFFLTYFVTKTGRTNVGSTFLNPQSSKIHRFIFRQKGWNTDVPLTGKDKTLLNNFKIAVALGMDFKIDGKGVDKLTQDEILAKFDEYMDSTPVKDALEQLATDGPISLRGESNALRDLLGKEGTHTLAALLAWQDYVTARNSGASSFNTSMPMEVDGVTNGFAAGLLQTPPVDPDMIERIKDLSRATGIYYDKDTVRSFAAWLKDPTNKDNYQAAARLMAAELKAAAKDPEISRILAEGLGPAVATLMDPKKGRDFAKNPLMIIAYGAGFKSVRKNMVNNLMESMYNDLAKTSSLPESQQMDAILSLLNRAVRTMNMGQRIFFERAGLELKDFQIKDTYTAEDVERMINRGIVDSVTGEKVTTLGGFAQNFQFGEFYDKDKFVKYDTRNLETALDAAYGSALEGSLQTMLAGIREVRDRYNHAVMLMNAIFRVEFDRRVDLEQRQTGRIVGRRQRSRILNQMHREGLVPSIRTAYSESLDENLELTAYEHELLPDEAVKLVHPPQNNVTRRVYEPGKTTPTIAGDTQSTTSRLTTRTPSMDVGVAGIVGTIHSLDGTNSADVFGQFGVLNVFDAWVMGLKDMNAVPDYGNQRFVQQHKEYDLGQELLTSVNRMMLLMTEGEGRFTPAQRERAAQLLFDAMDEVGQLDTSEDSQMPQDPLELMDYIHQVLEFTVPAVTDSRNGLFGSMVRGNQFSHDGSAYELTEEERGTPIPTKEQPGDYVREKAAAEKVSTKAATLANNMAEDGNLHKAFFSWIQKEVPRPIEALRVIAEAMQLGNVIGADSVTELLAVLEPHLGDIKPIKIGKIPGNDPAHPEFRELGRYVADEITLDESAFLEEDNPLETLLHEIVHAATDAALVDLEQNNPEVLARLNENASQLFARLKAKKNKTQQEQDILQVLAYQEDTVLRVSEYLAWTLSTITTEGAGDLGLLFANTPALQNAFLSLGQTLTRGNRNNPIIRSSADKVNNRLFDTVGEELLEADKLWENMEAMEALDSEQDIADASDYRAFISPVMEDILIPGLASLDEQTFLQLGVETDGTKNVGEVERASDRNILRVQAAGRKLNHNGGMSNQEVFAHELYHAVTGYVLTVDTKVRAELRKLYESVADQVTWQDFMPPPEEQAGDIAAMERAAQSAYNYIFGTPEAGVDQLQEFAALGLSNKAFALKLTQLNSPRATEPLWDGNILSFLVNLISRGLELIRSEQVGTRRAPNAHAALTKLSQRVVTINQQAQARGMDKGHYSLWRNSADAAASDRLTRLLDGAQARLRLTEEEKKADGSIKKWIKMGTHAALAQRTDAQQRANAEFLRHMGINKSSDLSQAITEILPYNKDDRGGADGKIGFLDLLRKSKVEVDIARQRQIEHTRSTLMDSFDPKRKLTKAERLALTNVIFRNDLTALTQHNDERTLTDIQQMLRNPALVEAEINRLEAELQRELARDKQPQLFTMYQKQIASLAQYMQTGIMGEVNGMKNAHNIVHQFNLRPADQVQLTNPQNLIPIVDQLATLRGIQRTAPKDIDDALRVIDHEMARTDDNGFLNTMGMYQNFKESSLEDLFSRNPIHMRKGYVYDITDGDINVEVIQDTAEERQRMHDLGMVELGVVDRDPRDFTSTGRRVLYKGFRGANTWQKATASLTSRQHQGTNLFEVAGFDPKETRYALGQMKGRAGAIAKKQLDPNFVQDPRETIAIPVLNDVGEIVDYTYEMNLAMKQEHLKNSRNNDYFDMALPRMFGSLADKVGTGRINSDVANLLRQEWDAFKDSPEHAFVEIGKKAPTKRGREMWQVLPADMKRELNALFKGEFKDSFPIRDDAVNLVLGFRKLSILDIPSGRGDDRKLIRGKTATFAARTAEKVWQEVMQLVRIKMAIINPTVVVGNLSSNFGILLAEGIPVRYIQQKTGEAIRSMRQYQRDIREIDTLMRKIGVAKANRQNTDAMVRRRERLIAEISRNPVAKLVQEGLFTSIVEDVTSEEDTYREWILSGATERLKGPIPGKAVALAKEAYMVPGSTAFNMAIAATQYGDFIGRYVKFKYETEVKGTPKRDAINGALASFIYYDMPQNRWLQAANDNGFLMFTKFFLRIQPVIARLFQENPLKATGVLAAQQALMNPFDENIGTFALFQGWENRFEPIPFRHIGKLEPTNPSLFQWLWPFGL